MEPRDPSDEADVEAGEDSPALLVSLLPHSSDCGPLQMQKNTARKCVSRNSSLPNMF